MKNDSYFRLLAVAAGCVFSCHPALSQGSVTLIGPEIRNGSFESGLASPWTGITVVSTPGQATDGNWFAVVESSLAPISIGLSLPADPQDGKLFIFSFDARMGTPGFDLVTVRLTSRTSDGSPVGAQIVSAFAPPMSADWSHFQFLMQMPSEWGDLLSSRISFSKTTFLDFKPHFAYVDNVRLTQIPEAGAAGLALLGAGLVWFARQLKARDPRLKIIQPQPGKRLEV